MESVTRTVHSAYLQTCQLLGLPVVIKPNSTLNQKFDINADMAISETDKLTMKYVTIGNGGHKVSTGVNGIPVPEPVQHTPRDAALYNHLPFVLRLPSNDLTANQRAKYRLRKHEVHDGVNYVAYYLKVLDMAATVPQLELRTVVNGVTTATPYVPTLSDLNPTPPAIGSGGVIVSTGDYIAATAKIPFVMTPDDINELLNVANVIYGDESYSIISEIGLCSGVDRSVTGDFNGTTTGYTEAIGVQVCNFIGAFFAAKFSNNGINILFDAGSSEAMLTLS